MESLFIKHCKTTKFLLFRRFIKLNLQIYIIFAYYFKHSTTMMKEFFQLMRRFVAPYKKFLGWSILLNVLSAVSIFFFLTIDSDIKYLIQDRREQKCISADGMGKR